MAHDPAGVKGDPELTPKMKSWGRLNSGQPFNIIAQDLDPAFALAGLGKVEAVVLQRHRQGSWAAAIRAGKRRGEGWPPAIGCLISFTKLERQFGISRQQAGKAQKRLIRSRMLVELDNGLLDVNKNVEEWIFPATGKPRLTAQEIAGCRATQHGSSECEQTRLDYSRRVVDPRTPDITSGRTTMVDFAAPSAGRLATRVLDDSPRECHETRPEPAAYRNGREEEIPETKREEAAPAAVVCDSNPKPEEPGRAPAKPTPQPRPVPIPPKPPQPSLAAFISKAPPGPGADSPAAAELGAWAAKFGDHVGHLARQWCDDLPAEWIRATIQRKLVGHPPKPIPATLNLLSTVLCAQWQSGVLESAAGPTKAGFTPKPPAPIEYFRGTPGFKKTSWRPPPRANRGASVASVGGPH